MESNEFDEKKVSIYEIQQLVDKYIDAVYYFYEEDIDSVKANLNLIQKGGNNALLKYFCYEINGHDLTKDEMSELIRKFINECVPYYDVYIKNLIATCNAFRYAIDKDDESLSVKNRFSDNIYYNHKRLEYLRSIYNKEEKKDIKHKIKEARQNADKKRRILQRLGEQVGTNYSYAQHIEYKFFLEKYIKDNNINELYAEYTKTYSSPDYSIMNIYEFAEDKIDKEIPNANIVRKKRLF